MTWPVAQEYKIIIQNGGDSHFKVLKFYAKRNNSAADWITVIKICKTVFLASGTEHWTLVSYKPRSSHIYVKVLAFSLLLQQNTESYCIVWLAATSIATAVTAAAAAVTTPSTTTTYLLCKIRIANFRPNSPNFVSWQPGSVVEESEWHESIARLRVRH